MSIWVVQFPKEGYQLKYNFGRNQHIQRKRLYFVKCKVVKKGQNLTLKVKFQVKIIRNFLILFFSLNNLILGAHLLLLTFFGNFNF